MSTAPAEVASQSSHGQSVPLFVRQSIWGVSADLALSTATAEDAPLLSQAPTSEPVKKPWGRFCVVFGFSIVASGLFPGQTIWTDVLVNADVCSSLCEGAEPCKEQFMAVGGVFSIVTLGSVIAFLPVGLLFDDYGGKFVGTLGAALNFAGFVLLLGPVLGASHGIDSTTCSLLLPAVLLTDLGMLMSSYSLFSLIFHFPGQQTLVIAMSNASMWASAFIPVFLSSLMDVTSCGTLAALCINIALSASAVPGLWILTPDKREFNLQAQRTTGFPIPQARKGIWSKVRTINQVFAYHVPEHLGLLTMVVCANLYGNCYLMNAAAYGRYLFNDEKGDELAVFTSSCTGIFGLLLGPVSAMFTDRLGGTGSLALLCSGCILVSCAYLPCVSWTCVRSSIAFWCMFNSVWTNLVQKHVLCYVPASRLGVGQGVFVATIGLVSVLFLGAQLTFVSQASDFDAYRAPLISLGAVAVVVCGIFSPWYAWKGVPDSPVLVPADERDIAKQFACRTLEQVAYVTGIPRVQILRGLGSGDALKLREIFNAVDSERLLQVILESKPPIDDPADENWDAKAFMNGRLDELKKARPEAIDGKVCALGPENVSGLISCAAASFAGSATTDPELAHDWLLGPAFKGQFDDPARLKFFEKSLSFSTHVISRFGAVLGVVEDGQVLAAVQVVPPGRLLEHAESANPGGSRFCFALQQMGDVPPYFDRSLGDGVRLRSAALLNDWATHHEQNIPGPHWYVAVMSVRPACQGRGHAKRLLSIVHALADLDGVPCYLETCGERNIKVYQKLGYKVVAQTFVEVDDGAYEKERSPPIEVTNMLRPAPT